jgi:hypothetical protein
MKMEANYSSEIFLDIKVTKMINHAGENLRNYCPENVKSYKVLSFFFRILKKMAVIFYRDKFTSLIFLKSSGYGQVESSCECGYGNSGSIKCWETIKRLYNWWPLE